MNLNNNSQMPEAVPQSRHHALGSSLLQPINKVQVSGDYIENARPTSIRMSMGMIQTGPSLEPGVDVTHR